MRGVCLTENQMAKGIEHRNGSKPYIANSSSAKAMGLWFRACTGLSMEFGPETLNPKA